MSRALDQCDDPIALEIKRQLDLCIKQNPTEHERYKQVISDEYFFIIMHSDIDPSKKIDLLEEHLLHYATREVTPIKPLYWK